MQDLDPATNAHHLHVHPRLVAHLLIYLDYLNSDFYSDTPHLCKSIASEAFLYNYI